MTYSTDRDFFESLWNIIFPKKKFDDNNLRDMIVLCSCLYLAETFSGYLEHKFHYTYNGLYSEGISWDMQDKTSDIHIKLINFCEDMVQSTHTLKRLVIQKPEFCSTEEWVVVLAISQYFKDNICLTEANNDEIYNEISGRKWGFDISLVPLALYILS